MNQFGKIYHGWKITGALAITETISWGILYYAFSVFLVPMQAEKGWSLAILTGAFSVGLLCSGVCAPLVGRWIDRQGSRLIMTAGSLLGVASVVAWSQVDSILMLYLSWVGIGVAMSATLYDPAFTTITRWFERDRNRAILIVTIAGGFASTIFLPLSSLLEEHLGWRNAILALAALLAIGTIPLHALVLRSRPEEMGLRVDGASAAELEAAQRLRVPVQGMPLRTVLHEPSFWKMALAFVLQTFAMVGVAIILIPYLTDRGDDPGFAATATGLIGAAQVVARILSTALGDRVSTVALTATVFAMQAIAIVVLVAWQSHAGVLVAVLLFGTGRGVVTLMRPLLVGDYYGRTHFGAINGTLALLLRVASALAPLCAGLIVGIADSFAPLLWMMAVFSLFATIMMLWLGREQPHLADQAISATRTAA